MKVERSNLSKLIPHNTACIHLYESEQLFSRIFSPQTHVAKGYLGGTEIEAVFMNQPHLFPGRF